MTRAPVILLLLIGQLLLRCEGVALRAGPDSDCLDAVPGDTCHTFVTWSLEKGLEKHPDWYPSFKRSDSNEQNFKQIQEILHSHGKGSCRKPCSIATSPPSSDRLEPPADEVQKVPDAEAEETPAEAPAVAVEEAKPEAAPITPMEEAGPAVAPAPAAQEAAPAAPAEEEAEPEAAPAAQSEEAKPADATAPAAEEQPPSSSLIGDLQAELKALQAMRDTPSLEMVRAEKRQLIHNLNAAHQLEAERKSRHLQNLQALSKLEAELKSLDAMDTTPAVELLRAEKRVQIEKFQTAEKSDSEETTREIQRLQDPAEAAKEAAPASPAEETKPALAQKRFQPPSSDLIGKLQAELKAMDQIHVSPALETLREEKRKLIDNLQTADKMEAELTARQLQNTQKARKLEADLKVLDAIDDTGTQTLETLRAEKRTLLENLRAADKSDAEQTSQEIQRLQNPETASKGASSASPPAIFEPEAAAVGRKSWWQRRWREAKPDAKEEAGMEEQRPEVPAAVAEEATPAAASAASAEEAKPGLSGCLDAAPGDRCYEFVMWSLDKGLEQHPDWFPSFQRSGSEEQNFRQMQEVLYSKGKAGCGKPC